MSSSHDSTEVPAALAVTLQGKQFSVLADRPEAALFWQNANAGRWEADTFAFVKKHCRPDTTFIDIGAWIGPVSLFASRYAARVLALEPDPVAYRDLIENIRVNASNVDVWHVGVDNAAGQLTLYAPSGLGQSITSSLRTEGAEEIRIPTVTFDQITQRIGRSDSVAVKVDIEGHEYQVIDKLVSFVRQHRAPLHLSVHPRTYYDNVRATQSPLAAKLQTWQQTKSLIEALRPLGTLTLSVSGTLVTSQTLFRLIFLRKRAKNFSVNVSAPEPDIHNR